MNYLLLTALLVFSLPSAFASKKHREHGAHQHGAGELSIAFDGPNGKIDFKSSSESIIGFEHQAKTAADKKIQETAFKKFEDNIGEIVVFETSLQCQFTKENITSRSHSKNHSNTEANFAVKCLKSPIGSKIVFNFQSFFPALHKVDVQILVDSLQKSTEIKKQGTSVELK